MSSNEFIFYLKTLKHIVHMLSNNVCMKWSLGRNKLQEMNSHNHQFLGKCLYIKELITAHLSVVVLNILNYIMPIFFLYTRSRACQMLLLLSVPPDNDQGWHMHTLATSREFAVPGWWRLGDVKTWELQGSPEFPSWPRKKKVTWNRVNYDMQVNAFIALNSEEDNSYVWFFTFFLLTLRGAQESQERPVSISPTWVQELVSGL